MLLREIHPCRQYHVGMLQPWHFEVLRQNTNNLHGAAVYRDGFVENALIAVVALTPERVRDQHSRRTVGLVFFLREFAAQYRCNAEGGKEVGGDAGALHLNGILLRNVALVNSPLVGHGFERPLMCSPIEKEEPKREFAGLQWLRKSERDKSVTVSIRQAAKEDRIDHAEDRGRGADAERERRDRCTGEHGVTPESTQRIAQVAQ